MSRHFLGLILLATFASAVTASMSTMLIEGEKIWTPSKLGKIAVQKSSEGFSVLRNNESYPVHSYDVDAALQKLDNRQLALALQMARLRVTQMSNDDYTLALQGGLKGGGTTGALIGSYIGQGLVLFVGHGTLVAISALTGPAAKATFMMLEGMFGAQIQAASGLGIVVGGLVGGVATGPV